MKRTNQFDLEKIYSKPEFWVSFNGCRIGKIDAPVSAETLLAELNQSQFTDLTDASNHLAFVMHNLKGGA
jgi:hypothetical protein